jgi:uncharacterized membrane protein
MSERVFFEATIEPNPPLRPRQLLLAVAGIALISFIAGVVFVLRGAWPVTPFFGADVFLLYWALTASTVASRRREHIRLTAERLTVERTGDGERAIRVELNPYWLRVEHDDPERVGAELALVSHGRRQVVGAFLGADERASLAEALRAALAEARLPDRNPEANPASA